MRKLYLIIIALATVLTFLSCRKDPLVNMQTITLSKENVTEEPKSVTIVGTFSYPGTIDSVRVCAADNEYLFNLETYPTVMSGKNFTATLTRLQPATTYCYYYAVYYGATKPFETEVRNFKTTDLKLPEVITALVSFVGSDNAICGGEVTDDGGVPVTARGVCYGQQPNPTLEGTHTVDSCGMGTFVSNVTGLLKNTKYYVRAYATNEKGTSYGIDMEFTTSALSPTVKTMSVTDIDTVSARVSCEVVSDGGSELKERGVCWSIHQNPTLEDEHLAVGSGVGLFTANVTGLNPGTKYYIRAYAKNGSGLGFGEVLEFTTANIVTYPAVSTVEIKNVSSLNATAVGNVSSDGGAEITSRGFCWSKTASPTIQSAHVEVSGTTGVFEGSLSGLEANTTYHVRAYAVNSKGAGYGEELTFTTTEGLPVVVTSSVTEITSTSAKCGGNVTDQGASNVTERGICWSTNHNPTIADSHASGGSGTGTYTCSMTGLTPNAAYYVRAYAKNAQGISYGVEVNFVALEGLPTVTTSAVTSITSTTATGGGDVTNQGASNVTERGICWGTEHNPAIDGSHASSGSGSGQFTAQMTGLAPGTNYHVRAYAKNSQGVTYGTEVDFTTTVTMPTVTTGSVSEITQTTATGGGNVTSDGGSSVTERGICWSTDANPTIEMSHIANGYGTGNFSAGMTGLTAGTTYHVRAYATNSAGTAYGNDVTFTTTATLPAVMTAQVSNITQTTAVGGGNVTADGGANVTERGVCWSINANPTVSNSHTTDGSGTGSFTSSITGLTAGTTYHVRAYAKNSQGTSYGNDVTFTTSQSISTPTVTTSAVTNITSTTATGGGNVTADGGANVTERGICWGTSQNPTTSGTHSNSGTGIGDFTVQMTGLTANTTYYVRAYATNSAGTAYGEQKSFTTPQNITLPTVTTNNVSNIAPTTATGGGNVTSDGGATVTARGICWSTSPNPTVSNSHTTDGSGTGNFTSSITGLTANTTYYVRAYATNSAGTSYGNELNFTTAQEETGNYFCITALDAGTTTVSMAKEVNAPTVYLEYKKNNGAWTAFTVGSTNISLSQNDKVFFKAPDGQLNNKFANDNAKYNHFVIGGGNIDVSGNIMYLLDPTGEKITLASANNYTFTRLFNGCNKLVSANQLSLPATTLAIYCYYGMFYGCTSLTTAPDLPATTLANDCYSSMFYGCTSLTTAPDLPATTLAMYCYSSMFYGCTSLTTAPDLPATTLAMYCYSNMFYGCTSLTTAPDLPATRLAERCYFNMFNGCSNLHYIRMLATENLNAYYALYQWVSGVPSTGDFYKKAGANLPSGINGIPSGWTVHNE